jgi:hypothetical protein
MNSITFTEKYVKKKVADFETSYIFEVEITKKWKKISSKSVFYWYVTEVGVLY